MIDCSADKLHNSVFNNNLAILECYDNVKSASRDLSGEFEQKQADYPVKKADPKNEKEASFLKKRKDAEVMLHGIKQNAIPWDRLVFNKEAVSTFLDKTVKKQKI